MKKVLIVSIVLMGMMGCVGDYIIIVNRAAYTVGHVNVYYPAGSIKSKIEFVYFVKNQQYFNQYVDNDHGWSVPANAGIQVGDKFMIQYDSLNCEVGRMLFAYPVSDSTKDFPKYVTQFSKTPPGY